MPPRRLPANRPWSGRPVRSRCDNPMRRRFAVLVTGLLILGRIAIVQAAETPPRQQVRFAGTGGIALAGTLTLPMDVTQPVPAVLLLQGSELTDRDGSSEERRGGDEGGSTGRIG